MYYPIVLESLISKFIVLLCHSETCKKEDGSVISQSPVGKKLLQDSVSHLYTLMMISLKATGYTHPFL